MNFQLKLKDGRSIDLCFSVYFLSLVCKMTDKGVSDVFPYILGRAKNAEMGIWEGGMLDDLDIRAVIVAAGIQAAGFAKGDYTAKTVIDGYEVMMQVDSSLTSPVWGEMFVEICKSLVADKLPKEDTPKKKAVRSK